MSNQIDSDSIVGSCNCMTKTNKATHHAKGCKYRLITERDEVRQLVRQLQSELRNANQDYSKLARHHNKHCCCGEIY